MNRRTFFILVCTIVVMSAFVVVNRQDFDGTNTPVLLPGLEDELNAITKITIRAAGNRTVATLTRGAERWTVAESGNYPADVGKIRQTLISLAKATVVEQKTADPALYDRLGVEDIAGEDATGIELVIDGPTEPYRIIIGKTGIRGDRAYARKPDSAVSLLIAADLNLGTEPIAWLDRSILDIPAQDIARITTTHPDGEIVRIENTGADGFRPVDLPADVKINATGAANSIGAVLGGLTFDDVSTSQNAGIEDIEPVVTRFETRDGLAVITNIYADGDRRLVGFEFTATDAAAEETSDETANSELSARAAALNARLGAWLFVLPDAKLDQLTHRRADLFDTEG